jgi:hypothetical protein
MFSAVIFVDGQITPFAGAAQTAGAWVTRPVH